MEGPLNTGQMQQVEQQIERMTTEKFHILNANIGRMNTENGELRQSAISAGGNIERDSQKLSEQARTSVAEVAQLAAQATSSMAGPAQKITQLKEMSRRPRTAAEETHAAVARTHAEAT